MFAAYKKALDKAIDGETDGNFGKLLLEILKVSVYLVYTRCPCVNQCMTRSSFHQNPGKSEGEKFTMTDRKQFVLSGLI